MAVPAMCREHQQGLTPAIGETSGNRPQTLAVSVVKTGRVCAFNLVLNSKWMKAWGGTRWGTSMVLDTPMVISEGVMEGLLL